MRDNDPGHKESVIYLASMDLMLHWIYCNIYTVSYPTVKKKIEDYLQTYRTLWKYDHKK